MLRKGKESDEKSENKGGEKMLDETLKSVKEAEAKAAAVLQKAEEKSGSIVEEAKAKARTMKAETENRIRTQRCIFKRQRNTIVRRGGTGPQGSGCTETAYRA